MSREVFFKRTPHVTLPGAYKYFGVKRNSYAATIVKRIYEYYCRDANYLFLEYLLYYRREFPSYKSFLDKKYNLFPSEIGQRPSVFLSHKMLRFEADGYITNTIEDESIKHTLCSFLGEKINDN
ncbi:MAG: hypothetical protein Q3985_00835 [Eubacteriales bacterium]|nr:hypothetical protein [Eubacteriales bacterium]